MNLKIVPILSLVLALASGCGPSVIDSGKSPGSVQSPVVRPTVAPAPVVSDLEMKVSYIHRYVTHEVKRYLKQFGQLHLANAAVTIPSVVPNSIRISFEVPHDLKDPESLFMNASYGCGHTNQSGLAMRTAIINVSAAIDNGRLFFSSELERIQDAFYMCRSDRITVGINLYNANLEFERSIQVHLSQESKTPKGSGKATQ